MTRQRIIVDPNASALEISGRVLNEMCAHALETLPEECCGLLSGVGSDPFRAIHRCRNDMTRHHRSDPDSHPRDGTDAYWMSETDYMAALEAVERRGEHITAVYHSHVDAGVWFSELDQEFADQPLFPFPHATQLVLAAWDRKIAGVGAFTRDPETGIYTGRAVEAAAV